MKDSVVSPNHYCSNGVETIKIIEMACTKLKDTIDPFEGYCIGNVIKYLTRFPDKGGDEDIKKAQEYLNILLDYHEERMKNE